ncbi:dorsal-ventral patterning protein tolloid-like [Cotesia glomerata]|uniref:CUB domain-containing protein n=1 Tax=Cotesia glomerata TaxID=32391 RepID=A0AAV7IVF4_COTGL|nr:dorsal-ventral patterning protein tolloid-like [Cotesia glomerata]KAH0557746.1 hypothetical protein KQX54_011210 [Cotesia glomerata]
MHYRTNEFACDRYKQTITPLKTEDIEIEEIGRREQLSEIDISGVNRLYNCSDCRKLLEGDHGTFNVTNDVNTSSSSTKHCEWRIVKATSDEVVFYILNLSIPESEGCRTNYLRVNDESKMDSLYANLCGQGGWEEVGSRTNQLLITYHTNTFNSKHFGFNGCFRKHCGGDIEMQDGKEYYLESPGFQISIQLTNGAFDI